MVSALEFARVCVCACARVFKARLQVAGRATTNLAAARPAAARLERDLLLWAHARLASTGRTLVDSAPLDQWLAGAWLTPHTRRATGRSLALGTLNCFLVRGRSRLCGRPSTTSPIEGRRRRLRAGPQLKLERGRKTTRLNSTQLGAARRGSQLQRAHKTRDATRAAGAAQRLGRGAL